MVAERRERKAGPTSWVQPEPAGKGKSASRKRAPAKKKQVVQPAKSGDAGGLVAAVPSVSHGGIVQEDQDMGVGAMEENGGHHQQQEQHGAIATTAVKGGAGPVETETGEQLFCICLGVDNGTPMIFCEACENWFHFECINLSEEDASRIATYYCDMCEQAGSGKTEWSYDAPSTFDELPSFPTEGPPDSPVHRAHPLPSASTSHLSPAPLPLPPIMTPSDSGEEHDNAEDGDYFTLEQADGSTQTSKKGSSKSRKAPASEDGNEHGDDDDYAEDGLASSAKRKKSSTVGTSRLPALPNGNQRRKSSSAGTSNAKRRKRVVEDEEEAEERRRKSASTSQFYGNAAKPTPNPSDPLSNPTRKHCIEQLEKILEAIFTAASTASSEDTTTVPPSKAREYAEAVELELFTHNCEPDAKGILTHSKKYTAKFRTLHFNLKSNEYFRSRVASGRLNPNQIYSMNQEDLLTPEVRAEQEAEKARSLAQSVKIDVEKPKTKITHKGEEVLDEFDSVGHDYDNSVSREQARRDSISVTGDTPYLPNEGFDSFSERERSMSIAGSPRLGDSPRFGSPSAVFADSPSGRAYSPVVESPRATAVDSLGQSNSGLEETGLGNTGTAEEFARPALPHHARSDSQSKAKLDLDAVWSTLRPTPASTSPEKEDSSEQVENARQTKEKEEDDMELESDDEGSAGAKKDAEREEKEYDPFANDAREKSNADDEFDALMGGEEGSRGTSKSKAVAPSSPSSNATDDIASLTSVWEGTMSLVDEGSFPARLVQVGGTPFGPHPSIWERVLPKGKIEITGRIDEKAASEYVVQSNFSHSRENVVLAILPNLETTSTEDKDKTEAMYSKLVNMYSDRKRYGVAPPSSELKKVTRDHYIVPLKKNAQLPDYVEILDSHTIPEKGHRKRDYLLSILVLQKGLGLNTTHRSSSNAAANSGGSTPQSSQDRSSANHQRTQLVPPQQAGTSHLSPGQPGMLTQGPSFSSHMSPPYQPPVIPTQASSQPPLAAGLPALDPAALQSLLSNPSLLQALSAGTQQGSPLHAGAPQYGSFSPPQTTYNAGSIPGLGGLAPPVSSGAQSWGAPPIHPQGYPPFPPPPGQWNAAGSPPWQGGQPPQQSWGIPPQQNHPPGYIDPERIKAASAEARLIGERERQERARGGATSPPYGGGSGGRSGDRNRNDGRGGGGRDRGFGNDDRRGGGRNSSGSGNGRKNDSAGVNQMQAGIQDRGWGRRG